MMHRDLSLHLYENVCDELELEYSFEYNSTTLHRIIIIHSLSSPQKMLDEEEIIRYSLVIIYDGISFACIFRLNFWYIRKIEFPGIAMIPRSAHSYGKERKKINIFKSWIGNVRRIHFPFTFRANLFHFFWNAHYCTQRCRHNFFSLIFLNDKFGNFIVTLHHSSFE